MPTKAKTPHKTGLEDSPQLVNHREVAKKFGVSPSVIRRWVQTREFPTPHVVIARTWFYKADVIDHKLRTGNWPSGVKFRGDRGT